MGRLEPGLEFNLRQDFFVGRKVPEETLAKRAPKDSKLSCWAKLGIGGLGGLGGDTDDRPKLLLAEEFQEAETAKGWLVIVDPSVYFRVRAIKRHAETVDRNTGVVMERNTDKTEAILIEAGWLRKELQQAWCRRLNSHAKLTIGELDGEHETRLAVPLRHCSLQQES